MKPLLIFRTLMSPPVTQIRSIGTKKKHKRHRNKKKKRRFIVTKSIVPTKYTTYIKSKYWDDRRYLYFSMYGKKCLVCGVTKTIGLHHKLYADYGSEKDSNLVALCWFHHEQVHLAIGKTKKDMIVETNAFLKEMIEHQKMLDRNVDNYY